MFAVHPKFGPFIQPSSALKARFVNNHVDVDLMLNVFGSDYVVASPLNLNNQLTALLRDSLIM